MTQLYDLPSIRAAIADLSDDSMKLGLDAVQILENDPNNLSAMDTLGKIGINIVDFAAETLEIIRSQPTDAKLVIPAASLKRIVSQIPEDTKQVVKLGKSYDYYSLKSISQQVFNDKQSIVFFISPEKELKGQIVSPYFGLDKIRSIPLVTKLSQKLESDKGSMYDYSIRFFDEKIDGRKYEKVDELVCQFYMYRFDAGGSDYVLFSPEKLESGEYAVKGTVVHTEDCPAIGQTIRIHIKLPLLFAHTVTPCKIEFAKGDFMALSSKLTLEELKQSVFRKFRHPEWYENLILSFIFSGEHGDGVTNYPLHLLQIAEPGTGKSTLAQRLHDLHKESQKMADGSNVTLKFLIPSFKEAVPNVGYLYRSKRIAIVDEFLKIIPRAGRHIDEFVDALGTMNSFLEHRSTVAGSGNSSVELEGKARTFFVTNPLTISIQTVVDLAEKIDKSWLSRYLPYQQTRGHVAYIEQHKTEILKKSLESGKASDDELYGLICYLQSTPVNVDWDRIGEIKRKLRDLVPVGMRDVFDPRFDHHIACVVDGLTKIRCFGSKSADFVPIEADYTIAETIFLIVIGSWSPDDLVMKLDVRNRLPFISTDSLFLFDTIEKNGECDEPTLQATWRDKVKHDRDFRRYGEALGELKRFELVKTKPASDKSGFIWRPYWAKEETSNE